MSDEQDAAVQRVEIVGAGIIGAGIAEVRARSGLEVILVERDEARKTGRSLTATHEPPSTRNGHNTSAPVTR